MFRAESVLTELLGLFRIERKSKQEMLGQAKERTLERPVQRCASRQSLFLTRFRK